MISRPEMNMKKPTLLAVLAAIPLCASEVTRTVITKVTMDKDLAHAVFLTIAGGTVTGSPTCMTSDAPGRFVIHDDSPMGKNMLALVLSAQESATPVDILGDNGCSYYTEKIK